MALIYYLKRQYWKFRPLSYLNRVVDKIQEKIERFERVHRYYSNANKLFSDATSVGFSGAMESSWRMEDRAAKALRNKNKNTKIINDLEKIIIEKKRV